MRAHGSCGEYAQAVSGRRIAIRVGGVFGIASALIVGTTAGSSADRNAKVRECGYKGLYGHSLTIKVRGQPLGCKKVRHIVRGRCDANGEPWFCFSFRAPGPPLAWIRSDERFDQGLSTLITASRYPCSEVRPIAEEWVGSSNEFPTRKQIVADDLIRCDALDGMNVDEVQSILGVPDYSSSSGGSRFHDYVIGLQRDSVFQLDSEVLSLRFSRSGAFREATIYQG